MAKQLQILLSDDGNVDRAFFEVPELRGFETFSLGRPAEEVPRVAPRIWGVCPTADRTASTKCLDDLWKVDPRPAAENLRELVYCTLMVEEHYLQLFFLGGRDFVVGPTAPAAERSPLVHFSAAPTPPGARHCLDIDRPGEQLQ